MNIEIRKAQLGDARRISYLIQKNAEKVTQNNYSAAQIRAWKKANTPKAIEQKLKERIVFCAFQGNQLVGTIGLIENEIVGLYVSYSKRGYGIGGKLLRYLENYVRTKHILELELTATPAGLPFYAHHGYIPHESVIVTIHGVDFPETKMKKQLP